MTRHVIVGKGAVGTTLAHQLADDGADVLVLSRTGGASDGRISHAAVDATDVDALTAATRGADVVYSCAAPPYHRWPTDWPPLWASLLDSAAWTGAVLVAVGNLYGYATHGAVMTEDTPLDSTERKGRVRAQMWRDAEARHRAGDLPQQRRHHAERAHHGPRHRSDPRGRSRTGEPFAQLPHRQRLRCRDVPAAPPGVGRPAGGDERAG